MKRSMGFVTAEPPRGDHPGTRDRACSRVGDAAARAVGADEPVLICVSGRGDKDVTQVERAARRPDRHVTTPTIASPDDAADELPEPPCSPQLVEEMLRNLARAIKTHQLYLPNNPIYARAIDNLRASFAPIWIHSPEIALAITESDFRWLGRVVMHETSRAESVPWVFFKDGVRELTMSQGIEDEELVSLLKILQRVRNAAPEEDDLLTLLWEQEFTRLKYRFVDINLDSHASFDIASEPPKDRTIPIIEDIRAEEREQPAPERRSGIVQLQDLDATLYFLDEAEIEYLRAAVVAEQSIDMPRNVLGDPAGHFRGAGSDRGARGDLRHSRELMLNLLSGGSYGAVAYLLAETEALARRTVNITPAHKARLLALPTSLSDPKVLSQLLEALDRSEAIPPQEELDALFEQLRSGTLGTVLGWLKQAQNADLRTALERAAGADGIGEQLRPHQAHRLPRPVGGDRGDATRG